MLKHACILSGLLKALFLVTSLKQILWLSLAGPVIWTNESWLSYGVSTLSYRADEWVVIANCLLVSFSRLPEMGK